MLAPLFKSIKFMNNWPVEYNRQYKLRHLVVYCDQNQNECNMI